MALVEGDDESRRLNAELSVLDAERAKLEKAVDDALFKREEETLATIRAMGKPVPDDGSGQRATVIPAMAIQYERPVYPVELLRAGISGQVVVDFRLDSEGRVVEAHAAASTDSRLEQSAVDAMRGWRFLPARSGGQPIGMHMQIPMVFTFDGNWLQWP
jgi:TonB family protein